MDETSSPSLSAVDRQVTDALFEFLLKRHRTKVKKLLRHLRSTYRRGEDFRKGDVSRSMLIQYNVPEQHCERLLYALWKVGYLWRGHAPGWYQLPKNFSGAHFSRLRTLETYEMDTRGRAPSPCDGDEHEREGDGPL